MQYRSLGYTGLKVSTIGLGTNSLGGRANPVASAEILAKALDLGINLVDTANVYTGGQSETLIGQALAGPLKHRREEMILATKAGMPVREGPNQRGLSRWHILREVDKSLIRLQTDYIDLFQVHTWDPETSLEETLYTLNTLVQSGKVRYVGSSNYRAWESMKANQVSREHHLVQFQSVQLSYSLADRTPEREILPMCRDQGMGVIAYYPLAGGILSGKYQGGHIPEGSRADVDQRFGQRLQTRYLELAGIVSEVANEIDSRPAQVALAWLLTRPETSSAIVGASRAAQVEENAQAADLVLPPAVIERLDTASEAFRWTRPFGDARLSH
ncbi:MAG: aldo/keto reductase [Firmicutes bacterium]|jgi:aryl-alcohol dehydrogenase-like predicted oxidoreductase|nr:aldo/keto reductase [Bacillota bacterium]